VARAFIQLRWIGDDDPQKTGDMSRWMRLYEESERLGLIDGKRRIE
jgi:hypothetical protein